MRKSAKAILFPIYFFLLKIARKTGLLYNPKICICISTTKNYASHTIPKLVESLLLSGVNLKDIFIFEGGHAERSKVSDLPQHFLVDHNSIDFTALIEAANMNAATDYWFFIHDTCVVSKKFARLIQNIPHFLPDSLPIKNYPSMNIGAYKQAYLKTRRQLLTSLKNVDLSEEAVLKFKIDGFENEDVLFKKSTHAFVYNSWLLKKKDDYTDLSFPIPDIYTNRICEFFPQAGIYKFKANYSFNGKYKVKL